MLNVPSRLIRTFLLIVFIINAAACQTVNQEKIGKTTNSNQLNQYKPLNIILMIGDGMGITQITAGLYANANKLNLERYPVVGLHKPYAGNKLITDSAAGATAIACGQKTYNGAIGVDMNEQPIPTILEQLELEGKATGLVATSTIVHATPASFIAHQPQRKMYEEIAADFLNTEVDIFIGGGKKYFDRRESDDRNLIEELTKSGYQISSYFDNDLADFVPDNTKNIGFFTSDGDPLPVASGRDYLVPATNISLNFLHNRTPNGFFLMIEGSQIDWGGHANNTNYIITEMIDFDNAIGKVLDFAEKDGNTLVIVTADHETGGFAIDQTSKMDSIVGKFTSDYHTGDLIPVFAYGPGSSLFSGIFENTAIFHKIREALQLK